MRSPVGWASTPLRRLRSDLKDPLLRNGYALLVNVGVTSLLGFLYWIVAARTYTPVDVGLSSTAVAVVQFLAGLAGQPSIANALDPLPPRAGPGATRLTLLAYVVAARAGALVSALYIAATHLPLGVPVVLGQSWVLALALGASVVVVVRVRPAGRGAHRRAAGRVGAAGERPLRHRQDRAPGGARAGVAGSTGSSCPGSCPRSCSPPPLERADLPSAPSAAHPAAPAESRPRPARRSPGSSAATTSGSIFALAAVDLLPVLVVARLGPADTAYFYLPFLIVYSVELVASTSGCR